MTGEPVGPPVKSGLSLVDFSGGLVARWRCSRACWRRAARRRRLRLRHLAVRDGDLAADLRRPWAARAGTSTERRAESAHPSIVPFQAFPTADGWITVAAAEAEVLARRLRRRWRRSWPTTRASRTSTRAPSTARPCWRSCDRCFARPATSDASLRLLRAAGRAVRAGQQRARRARGPADGRPRHGRRVRHPYFGDGAAARRRPLRLGGRAYSARPDATRTPSHCPARALGYDDARASAAREGGASDDRRDRDGRAASSRTSRSATSTSTRSGARSLPVGQLVVHAAHPEHRGPHFDAHYAAQTEWGRPLVDSTFTLALVTGQTSRRLPERDGEPRLGRGPPARRPVRGRHGLLRVRGARRCATRGRGRKSASSPCGPRATTRTGWSSSPSDGR